MLQAQVDIVRSRNHDLVKYLCPTSKFVVFWRWDYYKISTAYSFGTFPDVFYFILQLEPDFDSRAEQHICIKRPQSHHYQGHINQGSHTLEIKTFMLLASVLCNPVSFVGSITKTWNDHFCNFYPDYTRTSSRSCNVLARQRLLKTIPRQPNVFVILPLQLKRTKGFIIMVSSE